MSALIKQMNFFNNTQKRRIALLSLTVVVALIIGALVISRVFFLIHFLIHSHIELQPLLERARTIMDGTADPAPSEELDKKLYTWRFKKESHPSAAYVEVSPIEVTNIVSNDNNEAILTVSFEITRYRDDGKRNSWASYVDNKWYVRKNGDRWIVYRIETKP